MAELGQSLSLATTGCPLSRYSVGPGAAGSRYSQVPWNSQSISSPPSSRPGISGGRGEGASTVEYSILRRIGSFKSEALGTENIIKIPDIWGAFSCRHHVWKIPKTVETSHVGFQQPAAIIEEAHATTRSSLFILFIGALSACALRESYVELDWFESDAGAAACCNA